MLGKSKETNGYTSTMQENITETGSWLGSIFFATVAGMYIVLGALMIFTTGITPLYLTYAACTVLLALGIGMLVKYFATAAYRNFHDYGFVMGALFVIFGGCALANSRSVAEKIPVLLGVCVLVTGVVMLQETIQLHIVRSKAWIAVLAFAILSMLAAIILVGNLFSIQKQIPKFPYWVLFLTGILNLICMMIANWKLKRFLKKETLQRNQAEQEKNQRLKDQLLMEAKMRELDRLPQHEKNTAAADENAAGSTEDTWKGSGDQEHIKSKEQEE